jgi:hypothetical protein
MSEQRVDVVFLKGKEKQQLVKKYGKSIQVNRKVYQLLWCEQLLVDSVPVAGLCDSEEQKIYIEPGTDVEPTLLHEIAHAEIAESGIRQTPGWNRDVEEMVVEVISQGIAFNYVLKRRG